MTGAVNYQDCFLHEAVRSGNLEAVRSLLGQTNTDVNALDGNGNTPLFLAKYIKSRDIHDSVVQILIEGGAKVDVSNQGSTPLYNAILYGSEAAVKLLLEAGALSKPDHLVLHTAARVGNVAILNLLLHQNRCRDNINEPDNMGRTPVFIAAQQGHRACLKMLIEKGGDLGATSGGMTIIDVIFDELSKPVDFVMDILDSSVHFEAINEQKHYFADFSVLAPKCRARQMDVISSLLVAASPEEKTEVLQHPLIELYLHLKWSRICHFFYLWIVGYVVFACSMSVYVSTFVHKYDGLRALLAASRWILIISATALLSHAILQCLLTHRNHFRKYEMWLNVACTSLSLIVAAAQGPPSETSVHDAPNWVLHVTSVTVLMAWTQLMLLIGRLPTYGYYALMFAAVLQNVIWVLMAFVCLLVGFSLSFSIQFRRYEQFSDPWRALVKTTVMMMGEFEYADLFSDKDDPDDLPPTSRVIFLMFIILTSIVLMNLMVGLAVSDIQSLQKVSHARKVEKQADFLNELEKVMCSKQLNSKHIPGIIKRIFRYNHIDAQYELKTSKKFRKSKRLSSKLVDSLVAIAKIRRNSKSKSKENCPELSTIPEN